MSNRVKKPAANSGHASFDMKQEKFVVEGDGQRFVPLFLMVLVFKKLVRPVSIALLMPLGFKYGAPSLVAALTLLEKFA